MEIIKLRDDYIKLGQAIKAANLVGSGVEAKFVIQDGLVKVNGQVWSARSVNENGSFEIGEILVVVAIEGVKLICKKA